MVSGTSNSILSNAIFGNSPALPIHLFAGSNDGQQPPEITSAVLNGPSAAAGASPSGSSSATLVVNFVLHDRPNQKFNLQFFVPQICNCTNCFTDVGIFSTQVTTDANGNAPSPISILITTVPPANSFVNATATNANNSTSQFSECFQIGAASACEYSLSAPGQQFTADGGHGAFTVTTTSNCPWTPVDGDSWITGITGGGPGAGNVTFTVQPNTTQTQRQSTITLAPGVVFNVTQSGPGPDFALGFSPSTINVSTGTTVPVTVNIEKSGGFSGKVTVTPPPTADGIKPKPGTSAKVKGATYSLKLKITTAAASGSHQLTFSGKDSTGRERDATLNVIVQ